MKFTTALAISATAGLVAATGPVLDPTTGTFTCPIPDAVYCAGDSLKTNIIIRCTGTVGQPGNCNDNLAGEPPVGVSSTLCYAPEDGVAACAKDCHVYGGSGNIAQDLTLPADECTPSTPLTSATDVPTETPTVTPTQSATDVPTETPTVTPTQSATDVPTETPTATDVPTTTPTDTPTQSATDTPTDTATDTPTDTATQAPTQTTAATLPPTTLPGNVVTITITDCGSTAAPPTTMANSTIVGTAPPTSVNTPVGPSGTNTPPFPNMAAGNKAGFGLAVAAFVLALVF